MTMDELFDDAVRASTLRREQLRGCSESEIGEIEQQCGVKLPPVYRRFLQIAGKGAGPILAGTDAFYPRLLQLREWAEELLADAGVDYRLPPSVFVFGMHQGYEFVAFDTVGREDPPVIQFVEGDEHPSVVWPSFSQYIAELVAQHGRV